MLKFCVFVTVVLKLEKWYDKWDLIDSTTYIPLTVSCLSNYVINLRKKISLWPCDLSRHAQRMNWVWCFLFISAPVNFRQRCNLLTTFWKVIHFRDFIYLDVCCSDMNLYRVIFSVCTYLLLLADRRTIKAEPRS